VYCAEDFDNTWVEDHFKSVSLSATCKISERKVTEQTTGDYYVGLTVEGASRLKARQISGLPWFEESSDNADSGQSETENLHLVPYYFRANRGGRGQMRVGFKRTQ